MKGNKVVRILTYAVVVTSLTMAGFGCKKEEPKEVVAPAQQVQQAAQGPKTVANAPLTEFKAEITALNPPATLKVGEKTKVDVKLKNASNVTWPSLGLPGAKYKVHLAYHWLDKTGHSVVEGMRTDLPYDLEPGKEITLNADVIAPPKPGDYTLEIDMVQELVAWFGLKGKGSTVASPKVTVN
jgi:hypothetical protein